MRKLVMALGGSGVVSVLAAMDWPGLIVLATIVVFVVLAVCWALNDRDRSNRLNRLVRELRRRHGSGGSS
jgi:Flp pilus assembly protein TadB